MSDLMDALGLDEWCRRYAILDQLRQPLLNAMQRLRDDGFAAEVEASRWMDEHEAELPEALRALRERARYSLADADALTAYSAEMWEKYMVRGEAPAPDPADFPPSGVGAPTPPHQE